MCQLIFSLLAALAATPLLAADCSKLASTAKAREAYIRPPHSFELTGTGRLYFHSAPDAQCRSKAVFVVPGDRLIAYSAVDDWYSVMYLNPKTGEDVSGWVRSERLKDRGTVGPSS